MKRRILLALSIPILGATCTIGLYRPLYPSQSWSASFVEAGSSARPAGVYRMLICPHLVYVHLSEASSGRWFLIDLKSRRVSAPNGPKKVPYLSYRYDASRGIPLDASDKLGTWTVAFSGDGVEFENEILRVSVVRQQ